MSYRRHKNRVRVRRLFFYESSRSKLEIVAIVAGVVSIILGLFAIWQSYKVNRITMAKLLGIEQDTKFTMKLTAAQLESTKVIEERRKEDMKKIWETWSSQISAGDDKTKKDIISVVRPLVDSSILLKLTKILNERKRNNLNMSDTVRAETEKADKESRISSMLAHASPTELAILKAISRIHDEWISSNDLEDECKYEWIEIVPAILLADGHGLIRISQDMYGDVYGDRDICDYLSGKGFRFQLDPDLKEALLR